MKSLRFAVIGAGRLGASLGLALRALGPTLVGYVARTSTGRSRAEGWLGGSASARLEDLVAQKPQLCFLAVPDSELPEVAARLGALLDSGDAPLVAHTSGATSVEILDPCAKTGAVTFAFHPLQTFADPPTATERFSEAAVAITPGAPDDSGASVGFAIARLLRARPFLLADHHRALYHAAASLACNYLVTLQHLATDMFVRSGLPPDDALSMFLPLVRATLDNIELYGTTQALTGPLSRGDIDTIRSHLAAISRDATEIDAVYRTLGLATLAIVRERKEVDTSTREELAGLLGAPCGNLTDKPV